MSWAERVLPCDLARIMFYYIETASCAILYIKAQK